MHKILQIQQSFYKNIFEKNSDLSFISSNFPEDRLNIYRNTIFDNMINALKITYPGIWQLLGNECAKTAAYAYCNVKYNLPTTGCLDDFGENFPNFLGSLNQLSNLPYLQDYAYYEQLKHLSYIAADARPIEPSDLANVPEHMVDHVRFTFCPSVYVFDSKYPLFDIHEIIENNSAKSITLTQNPAYVVINRQEGEVYSYWISEDRWFFIKKLVEGASILEAFKCANNIVGLVDFDLKSAVIFMLKSGLVNEINTKSK